MFNYIFAGTDVDNRREGIYRERAFDFPNNVERFIFFSKAVVHLARYLPWQPEMMHLHDWQTALAPALMFEQEQNDGWASAPATRLTIHNLAYQGRFPRRTIRLD